MQVRLASARRATPRARLVPRRSYPAGSSRVVDQLLLIHQVDRIMNLVRSVMSVFLLALLVISVCGWFWANGQPSPTREGAKVALALCAAGSAFTMWIIWREKPGDMPIEANDSSPSVAS